MGQWRGVVLALAFDHSLGAHTSNLAPRKNGGAEIQIRMGKIKGGRALPVTAFRGRVIS